MQRAASSQIPVANSYAAWFQPFAACVDEEDGDEDVVFNVGPHKTQVRAHSFLLKKLGSDYFGKMLTTPTEEHRRKCIELPMRDPKIFLMFKRFIYTGKLDFAELETVAAKPESPLSFLLLELFDSAQEYFIGGERLHSFQKYMLSQEVVDCIKAMFEKFAAQKVDDEEQVACLCSDWVRLGTGQFAPQLKVFAEHIEKLLGDRLRWGGNFFQLMCFATEHGLSALRDQGLKMLVVENRLEYHGSDLGTRMHTIEAAQQKFDLEFGLPHLLEVGSAHPLVRLRCFSDCAAELLSAGYSTQWMLREHDFVLPKRIREVEWALTEQLHTSVNSTAHGENPSATLQEEKKTLSFSLTDSMSEGSVRLPEELQKKVLALRDERHDLENRIAALERRALLAEARVRELEAPRRRRWFDRACWNKSQADPACSVGSP